MNRYLSYTMVVALMTLGACTKTETVEVEKVVEKPAPEVPGNNSTINEQPATTPPSPPTVIATGSDMEVDSTSSETSRDPVSTPPPVVDPVPQSTSTPSISANLVWAQYLTGMYSATGNMDGKGTAWWIKDVGIIDLSKVYNLAAYPSMPAASGRPYGVALDVEGRILYFSDNSNHVIRQLDLTSGQVTTLVGGGSTNHRGTTDGVGKNARFNSPAGLALSPDKKYLYIADRDNHTIRRLTLATRVVELFAGVPLNYALTDGPRLPAFTDGPSVKFKTPNGIAIAADGTLYVADTGNSAIRVIAPDTATAVGNVTTLIKSANPVNDPFLPDQIFLDGNTLYITDPASDVLWKLDIPTKTKTAVAGKYKVEGNLVTDAKVSATCPATPDAARPECIYGDQARFQKMIGITKVGNKLYTNDYSSRGNAIFEIDMDKSALVTRIVGTPQGTLGTKDGSFKDALIRTPSHMVYDPTANSIYVAEDFNAMLRKLDLGQQYVSTIVGFVLPYSFTNNDTDVVAALDAKFSAPWHFAFLDDTKLLVADQSNCRIRVINLDGKFGEVITDALGQRKFNHNNTVGTFAGKASSCDWNMRNKKLPLPRPETGPNGEAGEFYWPLSIAVSDDKSVVYVAGMGVIQKVNVSDPTQVSIVAGAAYSIQSIDGVGQSATFSDWRDMKFVSELQPDGSTRPALYVLDADSIRRVSLAPEDYGTVTTVVGSNSRVGHIDSISTDAAFLGASRMAYVKRGTKQYLYVVERGSGSGAMAKAGNNDIREVLLIDNGEKKYSVKTVAGSGLDESRDGNGLKASFDWPLAIGAVVNPDDTAMLYVFDYKSSKLRKVDLQTLDVTTVSGNGAMGHRDGVGDQASWVSPSDILFNPKHNRLFLLDAVGNVRLLTPELP